MTTQQLVYEGGIQSISVVLPDRILNVEAGDIVEVTATEAKCLIPLPGWKPVKSPTKTNNKSEEDI
jgi:hypothetical protein